MKRRDVLKKAGVSATALAIATQPVASDETKPVRTIELDTSRFDHLHEANLTLFEDGSKRVKMAGTRPANPDGGAGFEVSVENLRDGNGLYVPEQATAQLRRVPEPQSSRGEDAGGSLADDLSGSGSSGDSGIGTEDHGGDGRGSNYEGGLWVITEDPAYINLASTEGWIDWTTDVDYVEWKWHAVPCETSVGTTWHIDDAGHSWTNWGDDYVQVRFYGDYYNYDWGDNDERTDTSHRLYATGNADGSMDWQTYHWHSGEDSGNLRAKAGYKDNFDDHNGHCGIRDD